MKLRGGFQACVVSVFCTERMRRKTGTPANAHDAETRNPLSEMNTAMAGSIPQSGGRRACIVVSRKPSPEMVTGSIETTSITGMMLNASASGMPPVKARAVK